MKKHYSEISKNNKKLLIGSGIVVAGIAAASAISYAITNYLMKVAIDREEPKGVNKAKKRFSSLSKLDNGMDDLDISFRKLEDNDCKTIEIVSSVGEKLIGHWYECENAERIIIAMHGWRSSWTKDFGAMADFFHKNNCSVLYAEQRGQNNSGGDYMGFGVVERYDCLDWINWANSYCGTDLPIYLAGVSMGASTVLMTAGLELPSNVHGIIADCGYTSPDEIWGHVVKDSLHMSYNGIRQSIAQDIFKKKIKIEAKDYSCIDAMKKCTVPVMFIHGTDDDFVPIDMTYENYKACIAPKRLFVVPGAKHAMSYLVDKEGYEKELKEFWQDYD